MKKTIVFSLQLHGSNSTFSSKDAWFYVETTKRPDFKIPSEGYSINSKKFPMLDGKRVKYVSKDKLFVSITLESDKTFYNRGGLGHDSSGTKEFKDLVKSYEEKGFTQEEPVSLREYYTRNEERERVRAKRAGLVLWMGYDQYQGHPEFFQGGFSDTLFNSKELKRYVGEGKCVHGWIGHYGGRTAKADKVIEEGFLKRGLSYNQMYNWISSSSGRHFGDSLEGYSRKEQIAKIKRNLNDMFNSCLVYGAPDHGGLLKDSIRIDEEFTKLGLLLPTNTVRFNKKKYVDNIFKVIEEFNKKKELNEVDKYIFESAKTIYLNLAAV